MDCKKDYLYNNGNMEYERLILLYEVIFLKEFYTSPSLVIFAGYINQEKKRVSQDKAASINDGQKIMLFFKAITPNLLFTLRNFGQRYLHVNHNLFCVTTSPVGSITTINEKLSESAMKKINQWVRFELNILGL